MRPPAKPRRARVRRRSRHTVILSREDGEGSQAMYFESLRCSQRLCKNRMLHPKTPVILTVSEANRKDLKLGRRILRSFAPLRMTALSLVSRERSA